MAAEILELRYTVGEATHYELSTARNDAVTAELSLARAQWSLDRIRYQLAWVTGSLQ
jgi:outer membrane protein TolC